MSAPVLAPARGSSVPQARALPGSLAAGPTALFALLVVIVLAAGTQVFGMIWVAVMAGDRIAAAGQACDRAEGLPADKDASVINPGAVDAAHERSAVCAAQLLNQQTSLALVTGFGALLVLTLALYWLYPPWTIRRRRLQPLLQEDAPALWEYLEELYAVAGLRSSPRFLIDPFADTTTGRTFGRLGQRWVCLDAGLVTWFTTDRRRFRAVMLHELAHLRNRDVDPTFLTMALWKAFVTVALAPAAVVLAVPTLFSWWVAPRTVRLADVVTVAPADRARIAAGLLVLTALMYLVRTAVLRVRELQADVRAAAWDGPEGALSSVVEQLSGHRLAGWRSWLASHPSPQKRRDAIRAPQAGFQVRGWHLVVAGIASAMTSVTLLNLMPLRGVAGGAPAFAMAGLVGAVWLGGPLMVGVWQAVNATAGQTYPRGARGAWLAVARVPVLLTVGFLIGDLPAFVASGSGHGPLLLAVLAGDKAALLAVCLLVAGGLLGAAWCASVVRPWQRPAGDGAPSGPPHVGVQATVIAMTILVVAPWLAAWLSAYTVQSTLTHLWFLDYVGSGPGPYLYAPLGWYSTVAHWTSLRYAPLYGLVENNPLVMIGVILPWLGPLILTLQPRRRSHGSVDLQGASPTSVEPGTPAVAHRYPLKVPLLAAVAGAAVSVVLALVVVVAARSTVATGIRFGQQPFMLALHVDMLPATILVGEVLAAVVVAVRAPRHRPVLVPLAVFAAGLLARLAMDVLVIPVAIQVDLFGVSSRSVPALHFPSLTALVEVLTPGIVLAVPAALVATAVRAALPRKYHPQCPSAAPQPVRVPWSRRLVLGGFVVVAAVVTVAPLGTVLHRWSAPVARERPDTGPLSTGVAASAPLDPCVVGVWHETSRRSWLTVLNVGVLALESSHGLHTFSADGSLDTVFVGTESIGVRATGRGLVQPADTQALVDIGHRIELTTSGSVRRRYRSTSGGYLIYEDPVATAKTTVIVDGKPVTGPPVPMLSNVDQYTCNGNTMVLSSRWYVARLERFG